MEKKIKMLILAVAVLTLMVGIADALAQFSPDSEGQKSNASLSSLEVYEVRPLTPVVTKTVQRGNPTGANKKFRLLLPWVIVGKRTKAFLPLVIKPEFCADRVVRTGDKLTFNGQEIRLIGVNVSYILEEWFSEDQWGEILSFLSQSSNTIRIPVFPKHARDDGLDRVERLIRLGSQYNLKFIVVLDEYYASEVPAKNEAWFRSGYKGEYMDHLRKVVTRLRDYPEVALWQLMVEPNCAPEGWRQSCCNALVEWARVASEEIKKLDPCRPVAVGMISIGGYQPHEEEAWRKMHSFPSIDVMTVHLWTDWRLEREMRIAKELNLPVVYTEVYRQAYKKNGTLIRGGILEERVATIEDFMKRSFDAGVDGIILWQYIHQGYCGELDYNQEDPVWKVLQSFTSK
jgi:aromatic ring-cleaving dioxygenase